MKSTEKMSETRRQSSPVNADDFAALRDVEVEWLSSELSRAISNLAYPVGMGIPPHETHIKSAAEALFERYAKMIEMARRTGIPAQTTCCQGLAPSSDCRCEQERLQSRIRAQQIPVAWRYRNEYDEVVSEWIDGPPPEYVRDANTNERMAVATMKIDVAYSLTRPSPG